jgi:hypothetical protein
LLALPRSRDPPRSDPLSNVVEPQAAAAAIRRWSANRRRRNPRRQPLTAWNRQCPACRRPSCVRRRQGRSPERREGQRGGISC